MSLQKQQDLLAKLYTDAEFRRNFLSSPIETGAQNGLGENEINEIAAIMPEELEFFAESLYRKRLREVEKILPLTLEVLETDFAVKFREFSNDFNPKTIKKHFEDALEFCRFLIKSDVSETAKNAAKFEYCKHDFFGNEKRFVICRLSSDIRRLINSKGEFAKKLNKIAIWVRIGKRIKHFYI